MTNIPLDQLGDIRIATPCPVQWEDMEGDGNVRFCRQCSLHVHNFSEMTSEEIARVIESRTDGERLCVGWYRRPDGTMITQDCPVGLQRVSRTMRRAAYRIVAAVGLLVAGSIALATPGRSIRAGRLRGCQPFAAVCEWLSPTAAPPPPVPPPPRRWYGGVMITQPPRNQPAGSTPDCGAGEES